MEWFEDLYNRQTYFDLYLEEDVEIAPGQVSGIEEILNLQTKQTILDVCCGYGRHSIELARRGYKVTGFDLSPVQIQAAEDQAKSEGLNVTFLVGDARNMEFENEFDVTLNLFTAFGYFQTESENLEMLRNIAAATKVDGVFLIDFWNREKLIRDFTPTTLERRSDGIQVEKTWQIDLANSRINWKNYVVFPDGHEEKWSQSVRAYALVELAELLRQVGFKLEYTFGDFNGNEYTLDPPQMITVCRKSADQ